MGWYLRKGRAPLDITYTFAGLVVTNRDRAVTWYERFFGRPPDMRPNDAEAAWQMTESASVYLLADAERAGRGVVTLVVDVLDTTLMQVAGRGIVHADMQIIPGAGRKAVFHDLDGNVVSIVELLPARETEVVP